jgi:NADH-quinone oxidoreductase subunit F
MTESGLFGKPTVVNNVKTLATVPYIIRNGAESFRRPAQGPSGTAVFAGPGRRATPTWWSPMGPRCVTSSSPPAAASHGKKFKAVQIAVVRGRPAGSQLELPVDFVPSRGGRDDGLRCRVLDEDDCMVEIARYFLEFTQRESCGLCTFCRLGTKQMLALLTDFTEGKGSLDDLALLEQLAKDVQAGALCGLGQSAPNPILTTLRYFRDEYEQHILHGKCPALMCLHLIAYYILPDKCERSCDACVGSCTIEAISANKKRIKGTTRRSASSAALHSRLSAQYNAIVKLTPPTEVPR